MNNVRQSLSSLWPSIRISLVLVLISSSIILIADLLGVAPNQNKFELENRKHLSESFAILFSTLASDEDVKHIRTVLSKIVVRDDEILSAGFRLTDGRLLFEVGPHVKYWGDYKDDKSTTTHVLVPIYRGSRHLGSIELRFAELLIEQGFGILNNQIYRLVLFVLCFGFFAFLFFVLRTLRQIDPSSVIPERVNAAFDTLAEGVVILDDKEQIVLANNAFSEIVKRPSNVLLGFKLSELRWQSTDEEAGSIVFPWMIAFSNGVSSVGEKLNLDVGPDDLHTMVINSAPIHDQKGNVQGVLITFDDVTDLEVQKQKLQVMVSDLELSQQEIQRQNKELHFLATRDPLTGSLNRRSFYDQFNLLFDKARTEKQELCCIMVDIDHFKRVNDNYGHAVGDEVIKMLANVLESSTRDLDIVGRYGGEEFCIVLPGLDIDEAILVAERIRLKIKNDSATQFNEGPRVTASLGVATIVDNAKDPAELNEQADQALYVAKESGRNRVIKWTNQPLATNTTQTNVAQSDQPTDNRIPIAEHSTQIEEIQSLQTQIQQLEKAATSFAEQLNKKQNYDSQTGLPNQALFYDRIKQSVDRSHREGRLTAILVVDFDLHALVNASFSNTSANEMYVSLSNQLSSIFRKTDSISLINSTVDDEWTVSRLERDEFGILIADIEDRKVIPWVVKRLFDTMNQPMTFNDKQITVNCKVGVSIFPEDANSPEELISHAYTAKSFAKKDFFGYQFFDPEMQNSSMKQLQLEADIRNAIENDEWELYYQPKMDLATGQIKGVEALIRWRHPQRGLLAPFEFIDLAEERGLITEIGEWVIRTACKQVKIWTDNGFDIKVAVNLSAIQLKQNDFSNLVLQIIEETDIKYKSLELEITETILMDNFELAVNTLNRLHCRGVHISMDDFGTGYSSLGYLKRLPINTLKIDRIFIKDIMDDDSDRNIVSSVISMAHGLGLLVIAEGVETQAQYDLLKDLSCDEIQGYLLSKPVPPDSLTMLLDEKALKCTS
jgi:diguanylate cyclase (GGDEF)-like protein